MKDDQPALTGRERRTSWLIVAGFAGMLVYLFVSHAHPGAAFIGCPFHALTGYSCPGCGMTRSTANFLHGDFITALRYHPFGPAFVVGFAIAAFHHGATLWRGRKLDYALLRIWRRVQKPVWVGAALFLGLFGVARLVGELTGFLTPI